MRNTPFAVRGSVTQNLAVPRFWLSRTGRQQGIPVLVDLPFDVQVAEIEFDPDMYEPLPVYKPAASRLRSKNLY